jgi:hypothetical protein
MRTVLLIGSAIAMSGCATSQRYAADSPRAWLPKAVPRATSFVRAAKYDRTQSGALRYTLDLNGCAATLASEGYSLNDAGAQRAGTTRYRMDLSRIRARADGNAVRLMSDEASAFTISGAPGGAEGSRGIGNGSAYGPYDNILGPITDSFNHNVGPMFRAGLNPGDPPVSSGSQTGETTRFRFQTKNEGDAVRIASGLNTLAAECATLSSGR